MQAPVPSCALLPRHLPCVRVLHTHRLSLAPRTLFPHLSLGGAPLLVSNQLQFLPACIANETTSGCGGKHANPCQPGMGGSTTASPVRRAGPSAASLLHTARRNQHEGCFLTSSRSKQAPPTGQTAQGLPPPHPNPRSLLLRQVRGRPYSRPTRGPFPAPDPLGAKDTHLLSGRRAREWQEGG